MCIAISGTHCVGKTTLIEDFIKIHPEYHNEVEPYYALQEEQATTAYVRIMFLTFLSLSRAARPFTVNLTVLISDKLLFSRMMIIFLLCCRLTPL